MSSSPRLRWRAAPPGEIHWAEWGDRFVLFHRPSGQTHFLNEASARLLQQVLVQGPLDVHDASVGLVLALGLAAEQARDPGYLRQVFGLLVRLEELGLARRSMAEAPSPGSEPTAGPEPSPD